LKTDLGRDVYMPKKGGVKKQLNIVSYKLTPLGVEAIDLIFTSVAEELQKTLSK